MFSDPIEKLRGATHFRISHPLQGNLFSYICVICENLWIKTLLQISWLRRWKSELVIASEAKQSRAIRAKAGQAALDCRASLAIVQVHKSLMALEIYPEPENAQQQQ